MKFILFLIFLFALTVNVRASSDDGNETDSNNSGDTNDSSDTVNNSDDSSNTSSTSNNSNSNDATNSTDSNTNNNNNSSTRNTNIPVNPVRKINRNTNTTNYNRNTYNNNNNYNSPRQDFEAVDPETGLTFGTLRLLSRLSPCKRQLLTNYRRLLRSPTIRLQFYRDLYQRHQSERVRTGCGEGDGTVKLGYRERAVLLGDPGFRARVEKMMRRRQPIGVALNGPVRYPNDIIMDNTQPTQNVLTISKQY